MLIPWILGWFVLSNLMLCAHRMWSKYFVSPPAPTMVPTCQILHTTGPSAWTSDSLTSMSSSAFSNCLELMGRDPFLTSYQRSQVLKKVKEVREKKWIVTCSALWHEVCLHIKTYVSSPSGPCPSGIMCEKIYGPASSFSQSAISQLGEVAVELSAEELSSLFLTERRSIAAMGAVSSWSSRQVSQDWVYVAEHELKLVKHFIEETHNCIMKRRSQKSNKLTNGSHH